MNKSTLLPRMVLVGAFVLAIVAAIGLQDTQSHGGSCWNLGDPTACCTQEGLMGNGKCKICILLPTGWCCPYNFYNPANWQDKVSDAALGWSTGAGFTQGEVFCRFYVVKCVQSYICYSTTSTDNYPCTTWDYPGTFQDCP